MLTFIDKFLNQITMYRLVWWELRILIGLAVIFSFFGLLPYSPIAILLSTLFLVSVSWIMNKIFSIVFNAPTNVESVYISALILALIVKPSVSIHAIPLLGWAALWAVASKYIFAYNKKHIFNPVAIAVVLTAFGLGQSANWWVSTAIMMPFVIICGLLIVRKIHREDLVFSFFITAIATCLGFSLVNGNNLFATVQKVLLDSSLFFLGFVMLTEPLTTPPTRKLQIIYGAFVGFLFAPQMHLGSMYSTPELALVVGNIFSYAVSPKQKLLLKLKEKMQVGSDLISFIFLPNKRLPFMPGQYMEWTLPHASSDSRGNRRYFTIASSPTEDTIQLGVKFYPNGSSFKKTLAEIDTQTPIMAGQLAGDFTLSKNLNQKSVFIAGGIGITPFRSMVKYLVDTKQSCPIVLFYSNKISSEIMYKDVFDQAQRDLGIKTVYTLTDQAAIPVDWQGKVGRIDANMISTEVPDYHERFFYLSGPHAMVTGFEKTLADMGVKKKQIKKDFFPGFV